MKKKFLLTGCMMLLISCFTLTQAGIRVVVLGSSTAAGSGPEDAQNAWVNQYRNYLTSIDPTSIVINLAQGGYTTYHIMPDGHEGHPTKDNLVPDNNRNITKALEHRPDAIIINMPTNDVSNGIPIDTQMENFAHIISLARDMNIKVWITTSQPHNYGEKYEPPYGELKQPNGDKQNARNQFKELSERILETYGEFAIDFYHDIATSDGFGFIHPDYDSGDGVHLNDDAHSLLFENVKAKNIPAIIGDPSYDGALVEPVYINFGPLETVPNDWNNANDQKAGARWDALKDATGNYTSLSLSIIVKFSHASSENGTISEIMNMNEAISKSYFASESEDPEIEIAGLNPNLTYNFSIFGARNGGGNRETMYTIAGKNRVSAILETAANTTNLAELQAIQPDEQGKVKLTLSKTDANNSGFSYINAMKISASTDLPPIEIPEGAIYVETAGTLPSLLLQPLEEITELVLYGKLNGTDIDAIMNLENLTYINMENVSIVSGGNRYFNGNLSTKDNIFPQEMFVENGIIEYVILPKNVTELPYHTFMKATALKRIEIPESVDYFGNDLFSGCTALEEIIMPSEMVQINSGCFYNCKSLTTIRIPEGVTDINGSLFYGCNNLVTIDLPESLERIDGIWAFSGCNELKEIKLSASIKSIANGVFYNCWSLNTIICKATTIPENVGGSGETPFSGAFKPDFCTLKVPFTALKKYSESPVWGVMSVIEPLETIIIDGTTEADPFNTESLKTASTLSITGSLPDAESISDLLAENTSITSIDLRDVTEHLNVITTGNANCLLIVPENEGLEGENIVMGNRAENIILTDDLPFRSPVTFTAEKITYSRSLGEAGRPSGKEEAKGWATITLPFSPGLILAENKSGNRVELAPYSENGELETGKNPFWLRKITATGFTNTSEFNANTPYIICFPNHEDYQDQYNIVGEVIFSAAESQIVITPEFGVVDGKDFDMTSTLSFVEQTTGVYAINEEGSAFVNELRDIAPFECYVTAKPGGATPAMFAIGNNNAGTTSLEKLISKEIKGTCIYTERDKVIIETNKYQSISIYHVNGTLIRRIEVEEGRNEITNLQKGIYIINNQKVIL